MADRYSPARDLELVAERRYSFLVIGYSATERPSDAVLSIVASARGVGLCFTYGKELPDPESLLRGSGNQTRSIHVDSVSALARPPVVRLIDEAVKRSRVPFSRSGKDVLVIRSVSRPSNAHDAAPRNEELKLTGAGCSPRCYTGISDEALIICDSKRKLCGKFEAVTGSVYGARR
jgi:hypothetical protein